MKRVRVSLRGLFPLMLAAFCVAAPLAALPPSENASSIDVPTLDGVGLASLTGVLIMSGAWLLAHRRSKKR
jgi:hypothetical protein